MGILQVLRSKFRKFRIFRNFELSPMCIAELSLLLQVSTPHPVQGYTKGTQVFDSLSKKKEKSTPPINIDGAKEKVTIKKVFDLFVLFCLV